VAAFFSCRPMCHRPTKSKVSFARTVEAFGRRDCAFDQRRNVHRLDEDLIGLEKNSVRCSFHLREGAEQHGNCLRIGVAHSGDDRETIPMAGHMKVAEKHVEVLGSDVLQSFSDGRSGRDVKVVLLKDLAQREQEHRLVIDE